MDNKDIFELIKRDILIKLLSSEEININKVELGTASLFYSFFMSNSSDSILDILGLIPDINICGVDINIGNVIEKLGEIKDKFDKYKQEFTSDDKASELYITKFDSLKGSIYEFDTISQLICDIICEYKKQNSSKQVVLIIEDLDRIDPGHIFRILNIFSAHFDRYTTGLTEFEETYGNNKFCLDKIVSVCDIDNIRNIYAHVYGEKTDFIGYISKFSNSKEYIYSLKDNVKWYITNVLLYNDLAKYPQICDILSDMIISSMDNKESVKSNLRIIKDRISKASSFIRTKNIKLNNRMSSKFLSSDSDLIKLLALLKPFELNFDNIIKYGLTDELVRIIGKYWTLAPLFEKRIIFEVQENRIEVAYIEDTLHGRQGLIEYGFIDDCIEGNQILDFDISNWDAEDTVPSCVFEQINSIVHYLERKFII